MRYYGEEALGLVETLGLVPALEAADKMLKAADVELISYENVGSTLVTIMVKGDVAAVRSSVQDRSVPLERSFRYTILTRDRCYKPRCEREKYGKI